MGLVCIPREDAIAIAGFYDRHVPTLDNSARSSKDFLFDMGFRIYIEWMHNIEERRDVSRSNYQANGFLNWINGETHYALERAGFVWDKKADKFREEDVLKGEYPKLRDKVLHAAVLRSIEYFEGIDRESTAIVNPRSPNLRISLKKYLESL